MRQRELLDFRTPQHPSLGTNHWGGASPLLARNVPKESLEQKYLNLNAIRTRQEIFSALDHEIFKSSPQAESPEYECPPRPSRRGILLKLIWPRKENGATLGSPKKKKWFPKLDPKKEVASRLVLIALYASRLVLKSNRTSGLYELRIVTF